jgi:hypothetical protein
MNMKQKTIMRTEFFSELKGPVEAIKSTGGWLLKRSGRYMTSSVLMRIEYKEATGKTRRGECEPKVFATLDTAIKICFDSGVLKITAKDGGQ